MTTGELNPMQRSVVDVLKKPAGWVPLPLSVVDAVRDQIEKSLAPLAEKLTPDRPLFISKGGLTTVHGCETHYVASLDSFEWTLTNARGTIMHKAVELSINWRGPVEPALLVDEALARLEDEEGRGPGEFIAQLSPGERAQLRSYAVDLFTKFEESFPPLKAAWRPVTESTARVELFGGRISLSTRVDLTLGAPGSKVIIDLKTGRIYANHREDLRFYALVEALRSGQPPRRLATYSLESARADVEEVSEGVLQAAVRRVVDGANAIYELTREERVPKLNPGAQCRWCPLGATCETGQQFLARDSSDD
ncbi:MAG: PD-(D/E)XK nuclease family protein [Actinobacteria bacterium]|nr:PD-(D/E)XK nuclease family protein [Actinomycetota bacterium]